MKIKRQKKAAFIPETELPKAPRGANVRLHNRTDMEDYERRLKDMATLEGDLVESDLSKALKTEFGNPDIEVVVLQGATFRTPDSAKNVQEEHDFVIIH